LLLRSCNHSVIDVVHETVELLDHVRGNFSEEDFVVVGYFEVHSLSFRKIPEKVAGLFAESVLFSHVENNLVFVIDRFEGFLHESFLLLLVKEEELGWGDAVQEIFDL